MHNSEGVNVDLYIPRKWCAAAGEQTHLACFPLCVPRLPALLSAD